MFFILSSNGEFSYADTSHEDCPDWTRVPVPQPCWLPIFVGERNAETGEWIGQWNDSGEPLQVRSDQELCRDIDAAADSARLKVVGESLRAFEYERAAAEAQAFKNQGYPSDNIPRTVAAWAINGRSAQEAAENILQEATAFNEILYSLREARLAAKESIRIAFLAGDVEKATQIWATTIASIKQSVAVNIGAGG